MTSIPTFIIPLPDPKGFIFKPIDYLSRDHMDIHERRERKERIVRQRRINWYRYRLPQLQLLLSENPQFERIIDFGNDDEMRIECKE